MPAWVPCCSAPCAKMPARARERRWRRLRGPGIRENRQARLDLPANGEGFVWSSSMKSNEEVTENQAAGAGRRQKTPCPLTHISWESLGRSKLLGKQGHRGDVCGCWAELLICPVLKAPSGDTMGRGQWTHNQVFSVCPCDSRRKNFFPSPPRSPASRAFLDCSLVLPVHTTLRSQTFANFLADFELLNRDKNDNSGVEGHVFMHWKGWVGYSLRKVRSRFWKRFYGVPVWVLSQEYPASASKDP